MAAVFGVVLGFAGLAAAPLGFDRGLNVVVLLIAGSSIALAVGVLFFGRWVQWLLASTMFAGVLFLASKLPLVHSFAEGVWAGFLLLLPAAVVGLLLLHTLADRPGDLH